MATGKTRRPRTRRPRISGGVQDFVEVLASDTSWSAAQIHRELERLEGAQQPPFDESDAHVPDPRSTERMVRDKRSQDRSAPWTAIDATADEARLVPDALAIVVLHSAGRRTTISQAEASAFLNVRLIAGDSLQVYAAYLTAALLVSRRTRNLPTDDIDTWLALKPWRSPHHSETYEWLLARPDSQLSRAPVALLAKHLVGRAPAPEELNRLEPEIRAREPRAQYEFFSEEQIQQLFPDPGRGVG